MPFVDCPNCGKESVAPREWIGLEWDCPHCRQPFLVRDDDDRPAPRRRRKKGPPVLLSVVVSALGIAASAAVLVVATRSADRRGDSQPVERRGGAPGQSKPASPSDDWTHRDLVRHLAQSGVNVRVESAGLILKAGSRPVATLVETGAGGSRTVLVYLCPSRRDAEEQAATMGAGAFASGRFAIGVPDPDDPQAAPDAELLARVRAALR